MEKLVTRYVSYNLKTKNKLPWIPTRTFFIVINIDFFIKLPFF